MPFGGIYNLWFYVELLFANTAAVTGGQRFLIVFTASIILIVPLDLAYFLKI